MGYPLQFFVCSAHTDQESEAVAATVKANLFSVAREHKAKKLLDKHNEKEDTQWVEVYDPGSQAYYYWNAETQDMTWDQPPEYKLVADSFVMLAAVRLQNFARFIVAKKKVHDAKLAQESLDEGGDSSGMDLTKAIAKAKVNKLMEEHAAQPDSPWVEMFDPASNLYAAPHTYSPTCCPVFARLGRCLVRARARVCVCVCVCVRPAFSCLRLSSVS